MAKHIQHKDFINVRVINEWELNTLGSDWVVIESYVIREDFVDNSPPPYGWQPYNNYGQPNPPPERIAMRKDNLKFLVGQTEMGHILNGKV